VNVGPHSSFRSPTAHRNRMLEILDGHEFAPSELGENLREIRLINRGLGWRRTTLRELIRVVEQERLTSFSYLDVATGSGDLPLALLKQANRRGWPIDAHALDLNPAILEEARRYLGNAPVSLHLGDGRALPFAGGTFDIVTCVLSLHHLPPDDAVVLLRELARVSRRAWILVDLERSLPAYLGARWLRVLLRNRLTLHDAPASILRAYTLTELQTLLDRAGVPSAGVTRQFPFRLVVRGVAGAGALAQAPHPLPVRPWRTV